MPQGFILGRNAHGQGPVQLLSLRDLQGMGAAPSRQTNALLHMAGFTFSVAGVVPPNTLLGVATWSKDLTFHNGDAANSGVDLSHPANAYAFRMLDNANNLIGNVNVTTAGVWSVVWGSDPFPWLAGRPMQVWTQVAVDGALAGVNARVVGYF